MNLYLVASTGALSYGEYDSLLLVAYDPEHAREIAEQEYQIEECTVTLIGKATSRLIAGDLVMGSCS